jgi:hypothetical protein
VEQDNGTEKTGEKQKLITYALLSNTAIIFFGRGKKCQAQAGEYRVYIKNRRTLRDAGYGDRLLLMSF